MPQPTNPILDSWQANARQWIATIDGEELESRRLVTNQAIVSTILKFQLHTVLDVGCGEGWLSRALNQQGISTVGVDAVPELIANARQKGAGTYEVASYQELIQGKPLPSAPFAGIVINFALLDKEITEALLPALAHYLTAQGLLFIQTLHPCMLSDRLPYRSGWRPGSWDGMKQAFTQPYDWYFRTLEDWIALFSQSGYILKELGEPLHPETEKPASAVFVLQRKAG
ncbi:MAG: class I SAM-dependent methyltransferase [Cyclobacteriaceae bacterium]